MRQLESKVVLVTGGSRGIGAATVKAAARAGARVGFSYRSNAAAATTVCDQLSAEGYAVHAVQGDVADPTFPHRFLDECSERLGAPDALVNNAGITGSYGPFTGLSPEVLHRTFAVNVFGPMLLTQELLRRWQSTDRAGSIVNISSMAALLGSPGEYVHYAASKAALDAFTIGLGKEVAASRVRVNAIAAGTVLTDIHATGGVPDRPARVAPLVPMRRVAQPEEIASAVIWLLSDGASYVTGTVMRVAGGM
jgi:NAD(P)-dependent dehydrogenase (short-subunit alcohol dehydrogenase family)